MAVGASYGPYTLLKLVGHGKDGTVFQGRGPGGQLVAVKVYRPTKSAARIEAEAAWQRKATAAVGAVGAGAVPAVLAVDGARRVLVMEWAPGVPLGQAVAQAARADKALPATVQDALPATVTALHRAGIDQNDTNAQNWLVDGQRVTLIDYGMAKAAARHAPALAHTRMLEHVAMTLMSVAMQDGVPYAGIRTALPRVVAAIVADPDVAAAFKRPLQA